MAGRRHRRPARLVGLRALRLRARQQHPGRAVLGRPRRPHAARHLHDERARRRAGRGPAGGASRRRPRQHGRGLRAGHHHHGAARRRQHLRRDAARCSGVILSILLVLNLRNGLGLADVTGNTQTGVIGVLLILSVLIPNLVGAARSRFARRGDRRPCTSPGDDPGATQRRRMARLSRPPWPRAAGGDADEASHRGRPGRHGRDRGGLYARRAPRRIGGIGRRREPIGGGRAQPGRESRAASPRAASSRPRPARTSR